MSTQQYAVAWLRGDSNHVRFGDGDLYVVRWPELCDCHVATIRRGPFDTKAEADEALLDMTRGYCTRETARIRAESPLFKTDAELAASVEEWMT